MNTKSFRNTLKEIATVLFAHDQVQLRASIVRAGCALSSVYAETQAEYLRNASLAVKYIVTQNQFHDSAPVRIMPSRSASSTTRSVPAAALNTCTRKRTPERLLV